MREGRSGVARFRPPRLLFRLGVAAASLATCASGCATEVNTLEPGDKVVAGAGGSDVPGSAGGKSTGGGSGSIGMAGSAGKAANAFGGTGSSAGAPASGGSAGAGGKPQSGASGSGGNAGGAGGGGGNTGTAGAKNGGATGTAGAGQAGTASGGSAGAGGGANLACLNSWKNDACDVCSTETQGDHLACVDILDCYAANSCGPATCAANDDKCGANKIGKGTAGYPIAQKVYDCLCK